MQPTNGSRLFEKKIYAARVIQQAVNRMRQEFCYGCGPLLFSNGTLLKGARGYRNSIGSAAG